MNESCTTIGIDPYNQTNVVAFSSPPANDPTFLVIVANQPPAQVESLEDFANVGISEHKIIYPDFKLLESGSVTLAGNPGYLLYFYCI